MKALDDGNFSLSLPELKMIRYRLEPTFGNGFDERIAEEELGMDLTEFQTFVDEIWSLPSL
jgi:hypothetical protein